MKDVVTQLAAVSKALDRAGFVIVASGGERSRSMPSATHRFLTRAGCPHAVK